jgi:hypothetical protein
MKQLTINTFPEYRPNITLERVEQYIARTKPCKSPTNKDIRLAIDLAKQKAPMNFDRNDVVRSLLGCNIPDSRINKVKSFKKITKKRIIVATPSGPRVIKVIRKRKK